jgi:hypothetical protein
VAEVQRQPVPCLHCGYVIVSAVPGGTCPECGTAHVDPEHIPAVYCATARAVRRMRLGCMLTAIGQLPAITLALLIFFYLALDTYIRPLPLNLGSLPVQVLYVTALATAVGLGILAPWGWIMLRRATPTTLKHPPTIVSALIAAGLTAVNTFYEIAEPDWGLPVSVLALLFIALGIHAVSAAPLVLQLARDLGVRLADAKLATGLLIGVGGALIQAWLNAEYGISGRFEIQLTLWSALCCALGLGPAVWLLLAIRRGLSRVQAYLDAAAGA